MGANFLPEMTKREVISPVDRREGWRFLSPWGYVSGGPTVYRGQKARTLLELGPPFYVELINFIHAIGQR